MSEWKTSITDISANHIAPRGIPIQTLMNDSSFGGVVYLLLTGRQPTEPIGSLIDAILISSIDHGVTPPSALAARNAASTGAALNACVASGVLSINAFHGGAIEGCMRVIEQVIRHNEESGDSLDTAAGKVLQMEKAAGRRVPGYGHRVHSNDPRTAALLDRAESLNLAGQGIQAAHALANAMQEALGRPLPLNVDGAIAACLVDLEIEPELANAFFMISRVPGLVAHAREEAGTQKPMRKIIQSDAVFQENTED